MCESSDAGFTIMKTPLHQIQKGSWKELIAEICGSDYPVQVYPDYPIIKNQSISAKELRRNGTGIIRIIRSKFTRIIRSSRISRFLLRNWEEAVLVLFGISDTEWSGLSEYVGLSDAQLNRIIRFANLHWNLSKDLKQSSTGVSRNFRLVLDRNIRWLGFSDTHLYRNIRLSCLQRLHFWEGYKNPSTYLQQSSSPRIETHHCCKLKKHKISQSLHPILLIFGGLKEKARIYNFTKRFFISPSFTWGIWA